MKAHTKLFKVKKIIFQFFKLYLTGLLTKFHLVRKMAVGQDGSLLAVSKLNYLFITILTGTKSVGIFMKGSYLQATVLYALSMFLERIRTLMVFILNTK